MTDKTPSGGDIPWGPPPPATVPPGLEHFPVLITLPVQWGEQDGFGHVNNVVFFRWFETSRIAYCMRVGLYGQEPGQRGGGGVGAVKADLILAATNCDYRSPVVFPDTVVVGARTIRIGNSSFTMEHVVYSMAQQRIAAEGKATAVYFNYAEGRPQRVPDSIRQQIEALEGRSLSD